MTTYIIEPGDWECATGESVDTDVVVRKVQDREINAALLMDLGFDEIEGKADCWEIEAEWGYLQVWMWESEDAELEIDLVFKIAAIGIIVAVLNQLLIRSGREDQAMMTTLAGLVVVLSILVKQISVLFVTIKSLFAL